MRIPFGKYKDSEFEDLPLSYLSWMVDNVASQWAEKAKDELKRRENPRAGVTTKLPKQVFIEELAKVLQKMPDGFEGQEYFIKTTEVEWIFSVRRKNDN